MSTNVLREITPLGENDFMYVADRHKKEFDYPIHQHEIFELNFVMGFYGRILCIRLEKILFSHSEYSVFSFGKRCFLP